VVLSGYDFNKLKPRIVRAVRDATGRELVLGGDIDLRIGLTPVLTVEDVRFQNASWGSRPDLARLKRFEVQVALLPLLKGDIKVKRFVMIEPDILVETDKRGRSNLDLDPGVKASGAVPEEEEGAELPQLTFERLLIKKGRFTYRDGRTATSYVVKIERLAASTGNLKDSFEVGLDGDYNGEPFEISGTLGLLASLADPDKAWPMNLTAKAAGVVFNIDGTVEDPLGLRGIRVDFRAEAEDLRGLERLADMELPLKGPLRNSGSVTDITPKTYKVSKIKLALGKSDLEGSMQATLAGKRPAFNAVLSSAMLDLRPLQKKKNGGAGKTGPKPGPKKREKVFSGEPLDLGALKQVNGSVEIKIKRLLLPRLAIGDLDARLTLDNGHLELDLLKASIGGGGVQGSLELRTKRRSAMVAAAFKANKIDLGNMLRELDITDMLEGRLDVTVDLKGSGSSQAEIMGSLDGNITLVMGKGQVYSKYLNLLGSDLRQDVFRLINPMAREEDVTEINCFVSRFDLKDGIAESTALVFDTTTMSVMGEGKVDLKTERLDFSLKPLPKKGLGTEGTGKLSLGLGELAKSLKLGGTLAKPSLVIDPLQTVLTIGKMAEGVAVFGPLGILAGLVSTGSSGENPCLTAIETAKTGVKAPEAQTPQKKDEKTTDNISEGIKEIEEGLRMFFGK
jgi:hypothetical protein